MERTDIKAKLSDLRRERGAAAVDGKPFKGQAEIDKLEDELDVLDDATAEQVRREREAAAAEARAVRSKRLKQLKEAEAARLQAWRDAQTAMQKLIDAVAEVLRASNAARVYAGELAPLVPPGLNPMEVERKIGGRLAEALSKVSHGPRLGGLQFSGVGGLFGAEKDWAETETKIMRQHIDSLSIQEGETNG